MPSHQNTPHTLQDEAASRAFRAEYDALLGSVIKPKQFIDFIHNAREVAPKSVLASAVLDIAGRQTNDDRPVPKQRRWLLKGAGTVTDTVEALDRLYRDHTQAGELVLYTYPKVNDSDKRGDFTAFHLTVAAEAELQVDSLIGREKRPDWYGIRTYVRHGADSPHINHGNAESDVQGSWNFFDYFGRDPSRDYQLGRYISLPYWELFWGTPWGHDASLPTITIGREAVLGLYEKLITDDAETAYTERRVRRPSYTLFRQAAYLADESFVTMVQIAEANGMADVWRQQIVDEEALIALDGLKGLHKRGKRATDTDTGENNGLLRVEIGTLDVEWLDIPFSDFVRKAMSHAARLRLDVDTKEIEAALHITLCEDMRNRWREEHRQRLCELNS